MTIHVCFDEFANNDFTQLPAASDWSCISQDSIKFFISVVAARSGFLGHNCYTKIGIFTYPIRGKCAFFQHTNAYTRTLYIYNYKLIIRKNS